MKTSPSRVKTLTPKEDEPDFGAYHHSSLIRSAKVREKVKVLFTKVFDDDLPFQRDDELKILDVGCGLGFLSYVCAEFYPNSSVTGFDTFDDVSLRDSSLEKARRNARILGLSDRIVFKRGDILRSDYRGKRFDLLVSNLVFHNLGKKRFDAYERVASWATPKSYVVLGDLFFDYKAEVRFLSSVFGSVERATSGSSLGPGLNYKVLVLTDPKSVE